MKPNLPVKAIRQSAIVIIYSLLFSPCFAENSWPIPNLFSGTNFECFPHIRSVLQTTALFNTAPVAVDDYAHGSGNTTFTGTYLNNDSDPDSDSLSLNGITVNNKNPHIVILTLTTTERGTIDLFADGLFSYTPAINFSGNDDVVYTICDVNANSLCSTATIYLLVIPDKLLPVNLTQFSVKRSGKDNFLQWITAQENNSDHFELECSTGNNAFVKIASIVAKGNSNLPANYSYVNHSPAAAVNYYRVKLIDTYGKAVYSKIVVINNSVTGMALNKIFTNPFSEKIELTLTVELTETININIYDINGKLCLSRQVQASAGHNMIKINSLGNLQNGTYFLKISGSVNVVEAKLYKAK